MKSNEGRLKDEAQKQQNSAQGAADQIVQGLERAFDVQGIADMVMLRIKDLERRVNTWKQVNGMGPK